MYTLRQFKGLAIVGVFVFLNAFIWSTVVAHSQPGELTVAFLDVGQGDAIFIEAPNGNQMLIDGGATSAVVRELGEVMSFSDRTIDIVLATHPDKDHVAGLIDVFSRYDVGMYIESGVIHESGVYQTLLEAVEEEGLTPIYARRGMRLTLDSSMGVYADILFPDRDVSRVETNLGSVILRVVYGNTEFMLTGDAPQSIEKYLVSLSQDIQSDVLKVGHHGSRTSTAEPFVRAVNPSVAVVSAGKDNTYGHPHKEVIDTLSKLSVEIQHTADKGSIIFFSNGERIEKK